MSNYIQDYKNKTVAVTGGSGYIASVLIDKLNETPAHILRISRNDIPHISWAESLKADIQSRDSWKEIVLRADIIFHLAGNTSVYAAEKNPVDSLNSTVLPITHLIAAAREFGRKPRIVFASTATVYGLTNDFPVSEDTITEPITNYDLHKLFAEKQLELASKKEILEGMSLRLANVYGPSSSTCSAGDRGILNKITRLALQGEELKLYGDGNYLRDYVYIDDVCRAFMVAGVGKKLAGRSFNVGSGDGTTVRDAFNMVVERVARVTGKRVHVENVPWPDDADPIEFRNFIADIKYSIHGLGWQSKISLEEGIDLMIESFLGRKKDD